MEPGESSEPETAFDETAPQASSSSAMVTKKGPWDVFIHHRGCDTKHKLASTIYHTLDLIGLRAFLDVEELELGDSIPDEIQEVMSTAALHIAIFSENYAQSPWCLAELSFMLKTGTPILPVFYHVMPDDLRWVAQGKGLYARAFSQHEKKGRYSSHIIEEWKSALQNVSHLSGYVLNGYNDDEGMLLESIVNSVLRIIKKEPLEVAKHPVAMDEVVKDFERSLIRENIHDEQQVQIVGIVGFGGSGKTTLATELYNRKSSSFNLTSFLHDVRDAASKNALHTKQKKLLEDLRIQTGSFDNVREGKRILENRLKSLCVLIVLDDVDDKDQLDALLPRKESLGSGSIVIVTTREGDVLTKWGITSIYKMQLLQHFHAKQLFCWHAFLQPFPQQGFEDLVENFLDVCKGFPLSLKVIGGQLYGKRSKDYWVSQLGKCRRILPNEIQQRLKVSYDALDADEQEIFLDIACFFIGEKRSSGIATWDGSGWSGLHGWETLHNKSLVEVDEKECIRMHDHLRDLGREIARVRSPLRFWFQRQSSDIQRGMPIRGIMAAAGLCGKNELPGWSPPFKEYMEMMTISNVRAGLQLLVVKENDLTQEFADLSRGLLWLRWFDFEHRCLPSWLSLENIRVLELVDAQKLETLWEDAHPPLELRELLIEYSSIEIEPDISFRFPRSIGYLKHLKKLSCSLIQLHSLPEEFCELHSLEHLDLENCRKLSSLPSRFGDLVKLQRISLSGCSDLDKLPVSFKQLIHLEYLDLSVCFKLTLESNILENMRNLKYLNFRGCSNLHLLPRHITNQASLGKLDLIDTDSLRELPGSISQLSKLEELAIGSPLLTRLPTSLGNLSSLATLSIQDCHNLDCLPNSLGQLSSLTDLSIENCQQLEYLPTSLGDLSSLTNLKIKNCIKLKTLPDSFAQLTNLEQLNLSGCEMLSSIPAGIGNLLELQNINLRYCRQLRALPDSFKQLIHLEELNLSDCEMLSSLPAGFGNLRSLGNINLKSCTQLIALPDSLNQLTHLEKLNLSDCKMSSSLPAGFGNLISLQNIDLKSYIQLSYDGFDEQEREMFLDAACFLIGENKSRAIAVWDGSGWNGLHGLKTLVNKCLVELVDDPDYNGEKIIRMHDYVRDMGREIASRHSPYRLWHPEQIVKTEEHSTDRKLIRGIRPADAFVAFKKYMHQLMGESSQRLRFSTGLQILSVEGNEFTAEFASLSEDLVWLRWEAFPLRKLPSWLTLRNLSVLELHGANRLEELWDDNDHAPLQLIELIITGTWSASFERLPSSISYLNCLKKIALLGHVGKEFGIEELPEEFCDLQSLQHLELRHCTLLSSLPARFGDLRNLRHLDLCSCKALRMLPVSFQKLALLNYLNLSGCKRLLLQEDVLGNITKLQNLYLSGCLALQKIPHQITDQACLTELQLQDTSLEDLPSNIGQLSKLEVLTIGSPLLKSLPDSLGNLFSLKSLSVIDCFSLESLPKTLGHLVLLEHLCIEATGMRYLPEGFRQLANLRTLKISDCPLGELDFGSVSELENLTEINLSETLVTRISIPEHCCPRLETLRLSKNDYLEEIQTLPTTVKNIELSECEALKNIKGVLALLPSLPNLAISDCPKELEKLSKILI